MFLSSSLISPFHQNLILPLCMCCRDGGRFRFRLAVYSKEGRPIRLCCIILLKIYIYSLIIIGVNGFECYRSLVPESCVFYLSLNFVAVGRTVAEAFELKTKLLCFQQDAFSLLAYSDPWNSPVGNQLDPIQREPVCSALNSAILGE